MAKRNRQRGGATPNGDVQELYLCSKTSEGEFTIPELRAAAKSGNAWAVGMLARYESKIRGTMEAHDLMEIWSGIWVDGPGIELGNVVFVGVDEVGWRYHKLVVFK